MRRAAGPLLLALALLGRAPPAAAQPGCLTPTAGRTWPAPLDRPVSLHTRDVSLRTVLDRLSASGRVSLSYSPDLLPLDRRVCLRANRSPLGDALTVLLAGTGVEPAVVAGQVVLVPARPPAAAAAPVPAPLPQRTRVLEEIVVTGSPQGGPRRELTVAMEALDGRALARRSTGTLGEALNGSVPGVWVWRQTPSSLLTQFGSVRGASSFGATHPKVYVDGVELANPLLVGDIDAESVERIEVIRGPQGAALYGSDAISGVINIVTRHGGSASRPELTSRAGAAGGAFGGAAATVHEQRLSLRRGSNLASTALAVTAAGSGGSYPAAGGRSLGATAAGRWVTPDAIFALTARVADRRAGVGGNPVLREVDSLDDPRGDSLQQRVTHYTLGASATVASRSRWTHTLLGGIDGYRLDYLEEALGAIPVRLDSTRTLARGTGVRATARAASTVRLEDARRGLAGSVTLAIEHSLLHQRTERDPATGDPAFHEISRHDSGFLLHGSGSLHERWYASAGARLQHSGALEEGDLSLLPMLGGAWVEDLGGAELKVRAAYGRGIRSPQTPARTHMRGHAQEISPNLDPEAQAGYELGAELYLGEGLSLSATRFDQRATGLIQDVVVGVDSAPTRDGGRLRQVRYQLQNVGAIENRGWEAQATLSRGRLALSGSLSLVDSRVAKLASGYLGDLAPGDRMLGVPARTAGLTAEWTAPRWSAVVSVGRAWDWIAYDRVALARAWAAPDSVPATAYLGPQMRGYWRSYDGSAELRATLWREVRPGVWLSLSGENLLGGQLGEPDNVTVRTGRTLMLGIRATL